MSDVAQLIKVEGDGSLSFGDYTAKAKQKVKDFEVKGDMYSLKTHNEITRIEKNETLLFEAVPGAAVKNFAMSEAKTEFTLKGIGDTQLTLELEPAAEYNIKIGGSSHGTVKTTMSGKMIFSAELSDKPVSVIISKI